MADHRGRYDGNLLNVNVNNVDLDTDIAADQRRGGRQRQRRGPINAGMAANVASFDSTRSRCRKQDAIIEQRITVKAERDADQDSDITRTPRTTKENGAPVTHRWPALRCSARTACS